MGICELNMTYILRHLDVNYGLSVRNGNIILFPARLEVVASTTCSILGYEFQ